MLTGNLITCEADWKSYCEAASYPWPFSQGCPSEYPFLIYELNGSLLCISRTQLQTLNAFSDKGKVEFADGDICGVMCDRVLSGVSSNLVHTDDRGWLAEVARTDVDGEIAMAYVSGTKAREIRGPHEHEAQTDRFLFYGMATVWLWDNRPSCSTYRNRMRIRIGNPRVATHGQGIGIVIVPPGVVHAYRNDANGGTLLVANCPDKLYAGRGRKELVDEIRHEKDPESIFKIW
jgi:dTDP-4-dehydrorhamnose 3,5-epimerase